MDFRQFWMAYEDVVRKARAQQARRVDDFAGTTISLTNPGTIGTVHSVPRLMPGQGTIIGVGAMEYPAEYQGASPDTLLAPRHQQGHDADRTYDHRIIQGAQSGEFLRTIHRLLLGEDGFYDEIFEALRIPYEPVRWVQDISASHDDDVAKSARVIELIHAYRVRGHLMADTDPLEYKQRKHPDLDIQSARPDAVGPGARVRHRRLRRPAADEARARSSACCATPTAAPSASSTCTSRTPRSAPGSRQRVEQPHAQPAREEQLQHPAPAQHGRGVRDVPADQVRRPEALLAGGRRVPDPAARRGDQRRRPRRASTRSSSAWPTAAGSTCSPTSSASPTRRSSASSRATSTRAARTAPAT